jgi:hypothetical protein
MDVPQPLAGSGRPTSARSRRSRLVAAATGLTLILSMGGQPPAAAGAPGAPTSTPTRATAAQPLPAGPQWRTEPSAATLARYAAPRRHSEQFYFALPDRFANGDARNDTGGRSGDRRSTGYDPTDQRFYHGGDLRGVTDRLDYIAGLGTTAIWLAPIFTNRPVQGSGADASAGYHGYWITDFTTVDPHFGTEADLRRLVDLAHRRGIKIYLDVIVNHTADVITNQQQQFTYRSKADAPYRDAAGHPFDDANHAMGGRAFPQVNAASFPYTPTFATPADATAKTPAWLNDPTMYHNRGDSTFAGENSRYGDFYGLDDLWTERPEVVGGLTKIYSDWITRAGIDGYRVDTVKHVDDAFWPQFTAGLAAAASTAKRDFPFSESTAPTPPWTPATCAAAGSTRPSTSRSRPRRPATWRGAAPRPTSRPSTPPTRGTRPGTPTPDRSPPSSATTTWAGSARSSPAAAATRPVTCAATSSATS